MADGLIWSSGVFRSGIEDAGVGGVGGWGSNLQLQALIIIDAECSDLLHHKLFESPSSDAPGPDSALSFSFDSFIYFFLHYSSPWRRAGC